MNSIRLQRYEKELLRIFNITLSSTIRDERLSWVSITEVKLSPDLQYAKVFYTVLEEGNSNDNIKSILANAVNVFKKDLASCHIMRRIPEIRFFHDDSEIKAGKIEEVLKNLKEKHNSLSDEKSD